MSNPYDQAAVAVVLKVCGRLTAAELAKILHWPRTRVRLALTALEAAGHVAHNNRTWEPTK
uniref:EAP30/Vps36 family protein n=1 Tax=Siphoviridae sp. ctpyK9 TaxID=2825679 RepID=A0A8S5UU73_9CAUD|nr:MAG TPA: EAP30/Vps36 family protein [Siphoviridae sp. ctpyK9]